MAKTLPFSVGGSIPGREAKIPHTSVSKNQNMEKSPLDTHGVVVNRWHPVAPGASQVQNGLSSGEMFSLRFL